MNEWLPTLSLALGSAWTSGINLYATVTVLGLLQKFGATHLPGGLDVLDNWWIIGVAGFLYAIEFFADKIPYVDSVWDVVHTFIRVPAGAIVAYAATNQMDASVGTIATLLGGGLAFSSHGTKAALRAGANLSPEPVSNWVLSIAEDIIAFVGTIMAVFAPLAIAVVLIIFSIFFIWFFPKVIRAVRRMTNAVRAMFAGESFREVARKAS
jgi:CBS domain containing-hemolysin-like protein